MLCQAFSDWIVLMHAELRGKLAHCEKQQHVRLENGNLSIPRGRNHTRPQIVSQVFTLKMLSHSVWPTAGMGSETLLPWSPAFLLKILTKNGQRECKSTRTPHPKQCQACSTH